VRVRRGLVQHAGDDRREIGAANEVPSNICSVIDALLRELDGDQCLPGSATVRPVQILVQAGMTLNQVTQIFISSRIQLE